VTSSAAGKPEPEGRGARHRRTHPLLRVVADARWDALLWTSGALATAGLVLTTLMPWASELAVFCSLTLLANGPYSMFLPAAVEPMVMLVARLYPAWLIAGLASACAVTAEYADFRIFQGMLFSRPLAAARDSRAARLCVRLFERAPFLAVVVGALTPLPFWAVRISAVLARYPLRRFLVATAVGRLPRFLFYASLGTWLPISSRALALGAIVVTVVWAVAIALRSVPAPSGPAGHRAA